MANGNGKTCKANIGTRKQPQLCGKPIAEGMLAACSDHAGVLIATSESNIYYRGGSYVVLTKRRNKQTKTFHRTLELAREARGDRTRTARQEPAARIPFDTYAAEWVTTYQGRTKRGYDPQTRAFDRRALEAWAIPHFDGTLLRDIGRRDVDGLVSKMQRAGLSAHTIERYLAPLRALFSTAVDRGEMLNNPALKLRVNAKVQASGAKEPARGRKVLTPVELDAVLAAIPRQHRLLFEVLAETGCRISEVLGLDWSDLEQKGARTTLRVERQLYRGTLKPCTKTDAGERTITLNPAIAKRLWAAGADAAGPMFQTRTGKRLNDRNLRRVLDAACERAAVEGVSFHTFRHSHGSRLIEAGWTIPQVSKRLGHADAGITAKVYSHAITEPEVPSLVGNPWATQHPETAANDEAPVTAELAD